MVSRKVKLSAVDSEARCYSRSGGVPESAVWFVREQSLRSFVRLSQVKLTCVDDFNDGSSAWHCDGVYCLRRKRWSYTKHHPSFALLSMSGSDGRCARLSRDGIWRGGVRVFSISAWTAFNLMVRHDIGLIGSSQPYYGSRMRTIFQVYPWWREVVLRMPEHAWMGGCPVSRPFFKQLWFTGSDALDLFVGRRPDELFDLDVQSDLLFEPRRDSRNKFAQELE